MVETASKRSIVWQVDVEVPRAVSHMTERGPRTLSTISRRDMTGVADPTTVLTFRSSGDELVALADAGCPGQEILTAAVSHRAS